MAKKKKSEDPPKGFGERLFGAHAAIEKLDTSGGVEIDSYALRWLLDSNVIFFGSIYIFAGVPAAGKSQFGYDLGGRYIDAGGMFLLIDTEHKLGQNTLRSKLGDARYNSGRFFQRRAGSINAESDEEGHRSWQAELTEVIKSIKSDDEIKDMPVFILVDSLLGSPGKATKDDVSGKGLASGKSAAGMQNAASISEYMSTLSEMLSDTKITVGITNHLKKKVNMGGPSYMPPQDGMPGGEAPKFHAAAVLHFKRGKELKNVDVGGREVNIKTEKNSFGADFRRVTLRFYYRMQEDAEGNVVRDDDGNPVRIIDWAWDEAGGAAIVDMIAKNGSTKAKALMPGLKAASGKVSCKTWFGEEKLSMQEFGRKLIENKDLYEKLREHPRLTINHVSDDIVTKVKVSPDVANRVSDTGGDGEVTGGFGEGDDDDYFEEDIEE